MPNLVISLKRTRSEEEHRCGVCDAEFIPFEDSGSRILSAKTGDQETLTAILCGGCYSKWTGGAVMTVKATPVSG
jgi:hypothetical protein